MTKDEIMDRLADSLYEETGYPIDIAEIPERLHDELGTGYGLSIYLNDVFGWATSFTMDFLPERKSTVNELHIEFMS